MSTYVWAIQFTLKESTVVANASDIGLYSNLYLRWSEIDLSSYSPTNTWKSGILKPNFITRYGQKADFLHGGNTTVVSNANAKGSNTVIYNSVATQLDAIFDTNNIRFNGLKAELYLFEISGGALVSAGGTVKYRGVAGDPVWTETDFEIPLTSALLKRDANIATVINSDDYPYATSESIGKIVPVTLGKFNPAFDSDDNTIWNGYGKFIRVENSTDTYKNVRFTEDVSDVAGDGLNILRNSIGLKQFPIVTEQESTGDLRNIYYSAPISGNSGSNTVTIRTAALLKVGDTIVLRRYAGGVVNLEESFEVASITINTGVANDSFTIDGTLGGTYTGGFSWLSYRSDENESSVIYPIKIGRDNSEVYISDSGGTPYVVQRPITIWNDLYLKVIEGDGEGEFRRIVAGVWEDSDTENGLSDNTRMYLRVSDHYTKVLKGTYEAKAENQTWVQIDDIKRKYEADVWPCKSFLDESGNEITDGLELYAYSNDSTVTTSGSAEIVPVNEKPLDYYKLPGYSYKIGSGTDNNTLDIDVKQFNNNPDNIDSFLIEPIASFNRNTDDTLETFNIDNTEGWGNYESHQYDGFYKRSSDGAIYSDYTTSGGYSEIVDKNRATYFNDNFNFTQNNTTDTRIAQSYKFGLPTFPKRFRFDSAHVCIMYESYHNENDLLANVDPDTQFQLRYRRFTGWAKEILSDANGEDYQDVVGSVATDVGEVKSDPDFWYSPTNEETENKSFYYNNTIEVGATKDWRNSIYGYQKFEIEGVDNEDNYNAMDDIVLVLWHHFRNLTPRTTRRMDIKIYQMAIAFKKTVSIKDYIYSPFHGRVFNDTWGGRKTATDAITTPLEFLEHILRLQNWSDEGGTENWGKEYAASALIDTSSNEGGFGFEDVQAIETLQPRIIYENSGKTATKSILKELCQTFFLCSFQDMGTGNEQVANIVDKANTAPTETIQIGDIIGGVSEVEYPKVKSIFCEPVIRYAKNYGSGEYDKTIEITNSNAASYDSSYVIGITGDTAEELWTRANALWKATHQIEKAPSHLTDKDMIVEDEDAIWYLRKWFDWMGAITTDGSASGVVFQPKKRLSFAVPYETGKDWFVTHHINVQFPHQTNNTVQEAIIETIDFDIVHKKEKVMVTVILYGSETSIQTNVQDTWVEGTVLTDWVDTVDVQATHGEGPDTFDQT